MKQARCFIESCQNDPEHICRCTPSHTIFCSFHARNHMAVKSKEPHDWIDFYFEPNPDSSKLIIDKVKEIKIEILSSIDELSLQYKELIETVEIYFSLSLEKYYELDKKCNEIMLFASQERVLNMPAENNLEELLKLEANECRQSIKYWKFPEICLDTRKIINYIEELYKNLDLNPFQGNSTANEIAFIRRDSNGKNKCISLNLESMTTSTISIDISGDLDGFSSVLIPDSESIIFHGGLKRNTSPIFKYSPSYATNNFATSPFPFTPPSFPPQYFNPINSISSGPLSPPFTSFTFIVDKDKKAKEISSGTSSINSALAYYESYVYALGGSDQSISQKYSLEEDKWTNLCSLPQGNYSHSYSALFNHHILLTGYCLTNLQSYDIKKNSFEAIPMLKLAGSCHKSLFCFNRRVYLFESGFNIYQSGVDDFSSWECIGTNQISDTMIKSYGVVFKRNIYFINQGDQLLEFNLNSKELKCVKTV